MTLQGFNHGNDSVMATDSKVISLANIMSQDYS
jgi:hypothetical protein